MELLSQWTVPWCKVLDSFPMLKSCVLLFDLWMWLDYNLWCACFVQMRGLFWCLCVMQNSLFFYWVGHLRGEDEVVNSGANSSSGHDVNIQISGISTEGIKLIGWLECEDEFDIFCFVFWNKTKRIVFSGGTVNFCDVASTRLTISNFFWTS